ncbi:CtsR family transcriptional regulator [Candidatus Contubernalis alkalaceticus]|nr:CtsR family transcriptional regulator [Candidatus Contubernalis alkalaceticus]
MAAKFNCVPSQINYVLSTRFTMERGYSVESRRGGGGYIRINKLDVSKVSNYTKVISHLQEEPLNKVQVTNFISRLSQGKVITRREAKIMEVVMLEFDAFGEGLFAEDIKKQFLLKMFEAVMKG